jgi:type VI protein secretion system component VasA
MRCTNRSRVSKLRAGEVCEPIAGSPSVASFTNIAAMGPRSSSPIGSEVLHAIVGLSAVGHGPRLTPSALRAWLGTCSVSPGVDVARARACASLAGAISAVHARPSRAARRGVVERGITIDLELEEARLPSLGEAFLLTRALDRALATELPLNVRQRVSSVLRPSGATIVLDPRAGLP